MIHSPSELVERGVDLGASPRAIICWGRLAKVWALLQRDRDRGLSGGHPGSGAVHPQPPHLARPARGQPRPHDRGGHPGHRRAGADPMRTRDRRGDREPLVNLADITEIELLILKRMRECHDRRSPQPVARLRLRLRRAARLAGRRPVLRRSTGRSRRSPTSRRSSSASSSSRARRRWSASPTCRCRRAAASTACRSPRPSPGRSPRSACRRCSSRIRSAWSPSTPGFEHLGGRPAADRQEPRRPLPRRLSARRAACRRCSAAAASARRSAATCASTVAAAGDLRLPVRRCRRASLQRAGAAQRHARRVPRAHRQRVRLRAAARSRRAGSRRSTSRPAAARTISRGALAELAERARELAGRRAARRRRSSTSTSCASASIRRQSDIALSEFVAERRLRKTYN